MNDADAGAVIWRRVSRGNRRDLARWLREVEDGLPGAREALRLAERARAKGLQGPSSVSVRVVGVTGAPGAGKSTLVSALVAQARQEGLKVGVLAVDPSSPFSGGALLGDRVRMGHHSGDSEVFVKSVSSRGQPGGISRTTGDLVSAMSAVGFDVVFVETVGVGQGELEVMRVADCVLLVLVPGAGDEIQAMKSGIMEAADVFVLNKADLPGAQTALAHIKYALGITAAVTDTAVGKKARPVAKVQTTIAHKGPAESRVPALWGSVKAFFDNHASVRPLLGRQRDATTLANLLRDKFDAAFARFLYENGGSDALIEKAGGPRAAALQIGVDIVHETEAP